MRILHVLLLAILTFCWIWSLPLLILGVLFAIPAAIVIFPVCICISSYMQYKYQGMCISNHWLRRVVSSIPWNEWFPCNTLAFKDGIIAVHPHGLLCCGTLAGIHFVPQSKTCMCIAPIVFYVPVIGWIARLLGCIPADKYNMTRAIELGYPLLVVPGGVPEIVLVELADDTMRFKRHGFLKIANNTNSNVHIVFVNGECNTFTMFKAPFHSWRVWLSWKLNVPITLPIMLGWYGTWIPKRQRLALHYKTVDGKISKKDYNIALEELYKK